MEKKKPAKSKSLSPTRVGAAVFIRTVSMYYTGRIAEITPESLVLEDAAWIADTGRFSQALKSGTFEEVEPFHTPVEISRAHVLDTCEWPHALPREVR